VKGVFNMAFINEIKEIELTENKNLTFSKEIDNKKDLRKYLKPEEIKTIINEIPNQQHKLFFIFLWETGLRVSEIINVKLKDIDFKNNYITINWLKNRKYKKRLIPIQNNLKILLNLYTANQNQEERLFPFTRQRAFQITKKYANINPHALRHSFSINLINQGVGIEKLYRLLGHSKIQTTMTYLNESPQDLKRTIENIKF
jgi:integrase